MPPKSQKINFKIFPILFIIGLFLFNITVEAKAMAKFGDNPNFNMNAPEVKVITASPPDIFNLARSETSNFTRVCATGKALNIVLDVTDKNKIEFQEPIADMCDNDVIKNLDDYVQIDKTGEVSVRSDLLPALKNKSANITMRNIPFEEEPNIEVDGRLATNKDIENKKWNPSSKTLTFKAKHFTTYKAVAATQPTISENAKKDKQQSNLSADRQKIILLISISVFIIFFITFGLIAKLNK
jgi:hypothetical protein